MPERQRVRLPPVCRDWIAGTCDRGTRCDRGHRFIQTSRPLAQIPLPLPESSSDPTLCAQLPPACVRAVQLERRMQQTLALPATASLQLVSARRVPRRVPVQRHALARPALGAVSRGVRALQPDQTLRTTPTSAHTTGFSCRSLALLLLALDRPTRPTPSRRPTKRWATRSIRPRVPLRREPNVMLLRVARLSAV